MFLIIKCIRFLINALYDENALGRVVFDFLGNYLFLGIDAMAGVFMRV